MSLWDVASWLGRWGAGSDDDDDDDDDDDNDDCQFFQHSKTSTGKAFDSHSTVGVSMDEKEKVNFSLTKISIFSKS